MIEPMQLQQQRSGHPKVIHQMLNTINNEPVALMAHTLHSNHDNPTKTEPKDYAEYDCKSSIFNC